MLFSDGGMLQLISIPTFSLPYPDASNINPAVWFSCNLILAVGYISPAIHLANPDASSCLLISWAAIV